MLTKQQTLTGFSFLLSTIGFLYQASFAAKQYFEYNTISVTKFNDETILDYPSLTLCQGDLISGSKLRELYPDYDCLTTYPNCTVKTNARSFQELHQQYTDRALAEKPLIQLLSVYGNKEIPWCETEMLPMSLNLTGEHRRIFCYDVTATKLSLSFSLNSKCFTFFSRLNKGNRSEDDFRSLKIRRVNKQAPEKVSMFAEVYSTRYEKGEVNSLFDYGKFPQKQPLFLVHAPDHIPGSEDYQKIGALEELWYKIYFTRTVSHLLKAPYKTNCHDYELGNENKNQSREECYQNCVLNWYRKECSCLPKLQFPLSRNNLKADDMLCVDSVQCADEQIKVKAYQMEMNCQNDCLPNCVQQTYSFEAEQFHTRMFRNIFTLIKTKEPDRVFVHLPEVTFIQFICNIASLAGMWLGLTVMIMFDTIINFLSSMYCECKQRAGINAIRKNAKTEKIRKACILEGIEDIVV